MRVENTHTQRCKEGRKVGNICFNTNVFSLYCIVFFVSFVDYFVDLSTF